MGIHHFDKHAQVGNELLVHLAREIGEPDNLKKVFKVVGQYASKGEWQDILANLSEEIRPLVAPALERAVK